MKTEPIPVNMVTKLDSGRTLPVDDGTRKAEGPANSSPYIKLAATKRSEAVDLAIMSFGDLNLQKYYAKEASGRVAVLKQCVDSTLRALPKKGQDPNPSSEDVLSQLQAMFFAETLGDRTQGLSEQQAHQIQYCISHPADTSYADSQIKLYTGSQGTSALPQAKIDYDRQTPIEKLKHVRQLVFSNQCVEYGLNLPRNAITQTYVSSSEKQNGYSIEGMGSPQYADNHPDLARGIIEGLSPTKVLTVLSAESGSLSSFVLPEESKIAQTIKQAAHDLGRGANVNSAYGGSYTFPFSYSVRSRLKEAAQEVGHEDPKQHFLNSLQGIESNLIQKRKNLLDAYISNYKSTATLTSDELAVRIQEGYEHSDLRGDEQRKNDYQAIQLINKSKDSIQARIKSVKDHNFDDKDRLAAFINSTNKATGSAFFTSPNRNISTVLADFVHYKVSGEKPVYMCKSGKDRTLALKIMFTAMDTCYHEHQDFDLSTPQGIELYAKAVSQQVTSGVGAYIGAINSPGAGVLKLNSTLPKIVLQHYQKTVEGRKFLALMTVLDCVGHQNKGGDDKARLKLSQSYQKSVERLSKHGVQAPTSVSIFQRAYMFASSGFNLETYNTKLASHQRQMQVAWQHEKNCLKAEMDQYSRGYGVMQQADQEINKNQEKTLERAVSLFMINSQLGAAFTKEDMKKQILVDNSAQKKLGQVFDRLFEDREVFDQSWLDDQYLSDDAITKLNVIENFSDHLQDFNIINRDVPNDPNLKESVLAEFSKDNLQSQQRSFFESQAFQGLINSCLGNEDLDAEQENDDQHAKIVLLSQQFSAHKIKQLLIALDDLQDILREPIYGGNEDISFHNQYLRSLANQTLEQDQSDQQTSTVHSLSSSDPPTSHDSELLTKYGDRLEVQEESAKERTYSIDEVDHNDKIERGPSQDQEDNDSDLGRPGYN